MNRRLQEIVIGIFMLMSFYPREGMSQCAPNMGFENGNLNNWNTATDSIYIQPANRVYTTPGTNMGVVNYGGTDMYLGTITAPNPSAGNMCIKVGNRGVRAVADTVYRSFVIDSLSDKLTIYSIGVVEQAHNYWSLATVEAPGFGYEIYINGQKVDCLRGSFFCGNTDNPPVWQLGTFKDTAGVRKSTGWGEEVLNLACFVGDTVEIRLFTRDCILLGHYAYAYFDVVCGDTTKPVISQIMFNDLIAGDELGLYCTQTATLELEPQTDICPIFMGNVQWTPQSFIVGPDTNTSVDINVPDSAWIYANAQFNNYCQTVTIIDSIMVRYYPSDPGDNLPNQERNYCECVNDTIDFSEIDFDRLRDQSGNTVLYGNSSPFIVNPCDNFDYSAYWKDTSSRVNQIGTGIGVSGWSSGNIDGGITYDSLLWGSSIKYSITIQSGKSFYVGINDNNSSNGHDMSHSVYVNGGSIVSYYNGGSSSNLGTFSGTIELEFRITSSGRVRIYINGSLERSYSSSQRADSITFGDYSARSNHSNHINSTVISGPKHGTKLMENLVNLQNYSYTMEYTDRCGIDKVDTITYVPGFNATVFVPDISQCGLDPLSLNITASDNFESITWTQNGLGSYQGPANNGNLNTTSTSLGYTPDAGDYYINPIEVIVTARSGSCTKNDTGYISIYEIPSADAGPDFSTTLDTFVIGGSPSGTCASCPGVQYDWTQGTAMIDSTVGNPSVIKNRVLHPMFILIAMDSTTGCFSRDTTYLYTSLAEEGKTLEYKCVNDRFVEISWLSVPDDKTAAFGVEFSPDGGKSWYVQAQVPTEYKYGISSQAYAIQIDKSKHLDALYRWCSYSRFGDRMEVYSLDELACTELARYKLYPNPFTEHLELNITTAKGTFGSYRVMIINSLGSVISDREVIMNERAFNAQIDIEGVENLIPGVYQVIVMNGTQRLYAASVIKTEQ